jgi:hypothetical protein
MAEGRLEGDSPSISCSTQDGYRHFTDYYLAYIMQFLTLASAGFSVIDPCRMMRTAGSAEKSNRPTALTWCVQVNINATRCRV